MRPLERLTRRKAFSEPPFWALDSQRWQLGSASLPNREQIGNDFLGYVQGAYKASGVVFSTATARTYLFAQARLQWRSFNNGRPGKLFGSPELALLEQPWPNGTTSDLLARMDVDATNAGNFYATTVDNEGRMGKAASGPTRRIARMRPDWVTIVRGSKSGDPRAMDARVIAYEYQPPAMGGRPKPEPVLLLPTEVCHYAPIPDPEAMHRGMSWITPVVREIQGDRAASRHKLKFFENGATLQTVVSLDKEIGPEDFDAFVDRFRAQHEGVDTAYKTLFLGGGADLTTVGTNMQQVDFKQTQGAGETRIAAAAGMHPVIVGLSEGLQGSSLNAGNFDAAIRLTADKTLRYLWANAAASLQSLVTAPNGASLTYDDRDIPFLRDDEKDVAQVQAQQAQTIRQYVDAGYEPTSVVDAVETGDLSRLKHTGLFSVQLQPPGSQTPVAAAPPPTQ